MSSAQTIDETTGELIEIQKVDDAAAWVAKQDAALLDVQVTTAKSYPRRIQDFQSDLESWCTLNKDTALECFFVMPRDGKQVVGPSVRFAELIQAAYGNLTVDSQIIEEGDTYVLVSATCRDLQRNIASRAQVRRSILTKYRKKFSPTMVETTIMAASAIARRNAIFQVVPKALWSPIYEKSRSVAQGDKAPFAERRSAVTKALKEAGCDMQNVKSFLDNKDPKDISGDQLLMLEIKLKAILANEITPAQAFPDPKPDVPEEGRSAQRATDALTNAGSKGDPKPKNDVLDVDAEPPADHPSGDDTKGKK